MNRFFKPTQSRYKSQFVPTNLPADLMAKTLYAKQGKADKMLAASVKLGEFEQAALSGRDTRYVEDIKKEVQAFAGSAMSQDRTSPEFQRKYLALTNKIKHDKNLTKIQGSVDNYKEFTARHKELIKKGDNAAAQELEADYMYRFNEYTKQNGQGFEGDMGLGDANTVEGRSHFEDALKFFTPMKDSGGESIKFLNDGISFKSGWTGVSDKRVKEQLDRVYTDWTNKDAFKQEKLRELQKRGLVKTQYDALNKEDKEAIDKEIDAVQKNNFLNVGRTVVHGKSTTNRDQALNARRTEKKDEELQVVIPTQEKVFSTEATYASRDKQIDVLTASGGKIAKKLRADELRVAKGLPSQYTADQLKSMVAQEKTQFKKVKMLRQTKNADYRKIYDQQRANVTGNFNALNVESQNLVASLGKLVDGTTFTNEDFEDVKNSITTKINNGNSSLFEDDTILGIIDNIPLENKYVNKNGNLRATLNKLAKVEHSKNVQGDVARNKTNAIWAAEYQNPGKSTSSMQMSGSNVRTDDNSTMAAVNKDVLSNTEAYNMYDQDGNVVEYESLVDFKGNSVTSGNFRDKGDFAMSGQVKLLRQQVINGVPQVNSNGNPIMKPVTLAVNVVPNGAHGQFLKNNFSDEQFAIANDKDESGDYEQANVARTVALNLNGASRIEDLNDFKTSTSKYTTIQTRAYSPDRRQSANAEFIIKKLGAGGYVVQYGNTEDEFSDVNEVNAYIQTLTNSTPQQFTK